MKDFQTRVVDEYADLHHKYLSLARFLANKDQIASLPPEEIDRLRKQLDVMGTYRAILRDRIEGFRD